MGVSLNPDLCSAASDLGLHYLYRPVWIFWVNTVLSQDFRLIFSEGNKYIGFAPK